MKHLIIFLFGSLLFFSCKSESVEGKTSSSEEIQLRSVTNNHFMSSSNATIVYDDASTLIRYVQHTSNPNLQLSAGFSINVTSSTMTLSDNSESYTFDLNTNSSQQAGNISVYGLGETNDIYAFTTQSNGVIDGIDSNIFDNNGDVAELSCKCNTGGPPECDSGGFGATSCSTSSGGGSCSVSCGGNSYACCNNFDLTEDDGK